MRNDEIGDWRNDCEEEKESEQAKKGKRRQSPSRESRIVDIVTQWTPKQSSSPILHGSLHLQHTCFHSIVMFQLNFLFLRTLIHDHSENHKDWLWLARWRRRLSSSLPYPPSFICPFLLLPPTFIHLPLRPCRWLSEGFSQTVWTCALLGRSPGGSTGKSRHNENGSSAPSSIQITSLPRTENWAVWSSQTCILE